MAECYMFIFDGHQLSCFSSSLFLGKLKGHQLNGFRSWNQKPVLNYSYLLPHIFIIMCRLAPSLKLAIEVRHDNWQCSASSLTVNGITAVADTKLMT